MIIDWSALDALGPAPAQSAFAPVMLHAPPKRQVAATVPPRNAVATPAAPTLRPAPEPPRQTPPPAQQAVPASAAGVAPALARLNTVRFAQGRSELPPEGQDLLNSIASQLAANAKLRLQLVAYASVAGADAVAARRLSLSRAVQMRSYLIAKGVPSVRMDVRALGDRNEGGGPADRVDVVILDH